MLIFVFPSLFGCRSQKPLYLGFVGDILPDRGVKAVIRAEGLDALFRRLPDIAGRVDLICANLEAAVADTGAPLSKTFRFNSPIDIGACLAKYGITAVNLANNHAVDYGRAGLAATAANLARYGVTPFGCGAGQSRATSPRIIKVKGLRVAFIGAVCFPLEGYVYLPDRFDVARWDADSIRTGIAKARRKADLVVVSLHWGVEFMPHPTAAQQKTARFCLDCGADLVVGHHPHVLQGMEIYRGKPIFYSLGNFIFDQRYEPARESVFVKVAIEGGRPAAVEIVPLYITDCVPAPAEGERAQKILDRLLEPARMAGFKPVTHKGARAASLTLMNLGAATAAGFSPHGR